MKNRLYWDDAYPIALSLRQAHAQVDPSTIDLAVLREWVIGLRSFADDPALAQLTMLEEIQREWVDLIK
ncbi:MAG: Fe-S cluster assembly protein IscX [Anaerolineae bacterium]|nr:Fe-S cluster assembly protein IscX [Anaerolineae bacterium]